MLRLAQLPRAARVALVVALAVTLLAAVALAGVVYSLIIFPRRDLAAPA